MWTAKPKNKKVRKAPLPKRLDFGCALHTKVRLTKENTAGILTYERRQMPGILPLQTGAARSNTVMAVAPDSNRISFSSTQLTTFQTVFSCRILSFFGFSIAQIYVLVNYAWKIFFRVDISEKHWGKAEMQKRAVSSSLGRQQQPNAVKTDNSEKVKSWLQALSAQKPRPGGTRFDFIKIISQHSNTVKSIAKRIATEGGIHGWISTL